MADVNFNNSSKYYTNPIQPETMSDKIKLDKAMNIDHNIAMFGFNNNAAGLA